MYFTLYVTHEANIFTLRKINKTWIAFNFTMKEQLNLRTSLVIRQKNKLYSVFATAICINWCLQEPLQELYLIFATTIRIDLVENHHKSRYEGIINIRIHSHSKTICSQNSTRESVSSMHLRSHNKKILGWAIDYEDNFLD